MTRSAAVCSVVVGLLLATAGRTGSMSSPPPATPVQPHAQAQGGAQPPAPQPPIFRTEANFVRVDAYPTRNGVPVEDLTAADFEVREDNVAQKIETFEHVVVAPAGPQTSRIEPNTVRDAAAAAADPRARVFVVFLDTYHVTIEGSRNIRDPLVRMLDRLIGQDDLVAVMTPEMSASAVTFARKTSSIEAMLSRHWDWGRRESRVHDKEEDEYEMCFPSPHPDPACRDPFKGVAEEMIYRRRAKRSLDALTDLAIHLRGVREERKAVLVVSNGWIRYKPNTSLARMAPERCGGRVPQAPGIFVGPEGRLTTRDERNPQLPGSGCERDRVMLAQLDVDRDFRDLLDVANRSNVSFYPVDPRGLAVFDSSIDTGIGTGVPPPLSVDAVNLSGRLDSLRTLAENTDGVAIVNSNNVEAGLRRVTADLTSYYLLGYYSTNAKLDGSFRRISVGVKRPGVEVRARHGYRAATAAEVSSARAAASPAAAPDRGLSAALDALSTIRRDARLHVMAAPSGDRSSIFLVGEIDSAHFGDAWRNGGEARIAMLHADGGEAVQGSAAIAAGRRSFLTRLDSRTVAPGSYTIRVRVSAPDAVPAMDSVHIDVAAETRALGAALLFRRGPFTTQPFEPTADRRFRRNQTLRVQAPLAGSGAGVRMRLLDRTGKPMPVPIAPREVDAEGAHWVMGDIPLAPLAAAEYLVEIDASGEKHLVAFAVVS